MKDLYFISESLPLESFGSFVIFYRHLKRLEDDGYKVHLIIPHYGKIEEAKFYHEYIKNWEVTLVPFKKWWFMPYRYNIDWLRKLRYYCLLLPIKAKLLKAPPDYIISYMHGQYLNGFAAFLSTYFSCPLGFFLHDDKSLLHNDNSNALLDYDRALYKKADIIWTVSKQLIIPGTDKSKYIVMRPIPQGSTGNIKPKWKTEYKFPTIGFAGSIYESYLPVFNLLAEALKLHSGKLIIIGSESDPLKELCLKHNNITYIPPFIKNGEAIDYLKINCSAVFCGYPDGLLKMPWIKSCFPSKFVEAAHIHLPIILSSPPETALASWANEHKWELFTDNYCIESFSEVIQKIILETEWSNNQRQVIKLAEEEFNPNKIQETFIQSLKLKPD